MEAPNASMDPVLSHHETVRQLTSEADTQRKEAERLASCLADADARASAMNEENDELRRGMEEILDSVKQQDGKSNVVISAPSLDRLLDILDARHLWGGDYHPAMGLKAKIGRLDGANEGRKIIMWMVQLLI